MLIGADRRHSALSRAATLGLAPRDEAGRLWVHQIQLTIADAVAEAHDAHHPISGDLYYEDQKTEALRAARRSARSAFRNFSPGSKPSWRATRKEARHLVGARLSYADLSLFQLVEGLSYAFPIA